jgi:membrane-associated phospholipid phosphatase
VNALARVISVLFHPLLMATYLLGLLSYVLPSALYPINIESRNSFLILIFLMTFVIPALNISFFRIMGSISSLTMPDRAQRVRPFFLIALIYGFSTYLFFGKLRISVDDNLFKLLILIDCLALVAAVITLFYKVSIHSVGVMGILGMLLPLNKVAENNALFIPTLVLIVIAGLVMSARLQLNSHTPREVLVGSLTGFTIGFFGMIILF